MTPLPTPRPRLIRLGILLLLMVHGSAWSLPVITEFMAANTSVLVDEDGTYQDWIEVHNPSATALSLENWCLTDSAGNRAKWRFPAVSLPAGDFLVVFASGKDRRVPGQPLHTNFSLAKDGEYLALVHPDGVTVEQEFAPAYPPQDDDRSFGLVFTRTNLVVEAATAQYKVPSSSVDLPGNWTTSLDPSGGWLTGPTGLGFGLTVPGFTYLVRAKNTATGGMNASVAETLLAQPGGHSDILFQETGVVPVMNVLGNGGDGHFGFNQPLPPWAADHYVYQVSGTIEIPTAGPWTFGINSDDGGKIVIDGIVVMNDPTAHGAQDHFGTVTLSAGPHAITAFYWEAGGGDEGELFAAPGTFTTFQSSMKLVGDAANGGLAVFTSAAGPGLGNPVRTNLTAPMLNQNASAFVRLGFSGDVAGFTSLGLNMRYNDGFVAHLNGIQVASANAPSNPEWNSTATGERGVQETLGPRSFNVTSALGSLLPSGNILAVQGLNVAATNGTFLVLPELFAAILPTTPEAGVFNQSTPGGLNGVPDSLGNVFDPSFSPNRGIYPNAAVTNVPFDVTLGCATPGASIRYTTDGSTPGPSHGTVYSNAVTITQTTVLRAVAYKEGWTTSPVDTHTYLILKDVLSQSSFGAPPSPIWPTPDANSRVNNQVINYGMDPDIVNHANPAVGGSNQVLNALAAIPSISIVADIGSFFNTSTGIYVNAGGRGLAWERRCSVEMLNDPIGGGFQANCGMRMRGGYSRSADNPKHAFHFYFRAEYGPGKLDYPVYGDQEGAASSFNQIDLRTAQNYSWSFGGDGQNSFLREEFSRQTFVDMGGPGSHVRYVHVYLNGQYWGLFNFDERTEADHCAEYLGGAKENWDVVKAEQDSGYITGTTDGDATAWNLLFTKANPLVAPGDYNRRALTTAEYYDLQGLAPDGVTTNASPVLLDVNALIDYMLVTFWTGNFDGATSAFLGNLTANNWFGARDRTGRRGFLFFPHDFEHSLFNVNEDRTGPFNRTFTNQVQYLDKIRYYNPMFVHADLMDVPEYRQAWKDRAHRHLFNGGALDLPANQARVEALASVVDSAIIAESARWGDAQAGRANNPLTRTEWLAQRNLILNTYLPARTAAVIAQLRTDGLYPSLDGITFSSPAGYLSASTPLSLNGPTSVGSVWYYTLDGSDPLLPNGSLNPVAQVFTPAGLVYTTLVDWGATGPGATWKYRDPSLYQGASDIVVGHPSYDATNWKHPDFDDSNPAVWKSGDAELGFGDAAERTVIQSPVVNPRDTTHYFRKKFTVANPAQYDAIELEALIDDGAIFYLNGREGARMSMPAGVVTNVYSGINAANEGAFLPVTDARLVPSLLVDGINTFAVQVHNVNSTSSDISFDLRLRGKKTVFTSPVFLPAGEILVRARAHDGVVWSALSERTFLVDAEPASSTNLIVNEIQYNPFLPVEDVNLGYGNENLFEYLELLNIGPRHVDLQGIAFTRGVTWTFDDAALVPRLLPPGGRVLVVGNLDAFTHRHGSGHPVAGVFSGQLSNSGEDLTLLAANGNIIFDFPYDDLLPWPLEPKGTGPSLVLIRPYSRPVLSQGGNWRASVAPGHPGVGDTQSFATWKTTNAPGQGDFSDVDADGLPLYWEYALGGDPAGPGTPVGPAAMLIHPDLSPEIWFDLNPGAEEAVVVPEVGLDLLSWSDTGLGFLRRVRQPGGRDRLFYQLLTPYAESPRAYIRLRATSP